MRDGWLTLVNAVLRPERPRIEHCLRERELHLAASRGFAERRARAIAHCEARIESARARVFAAEDGVVTEHMTELEREWRRLSRADAEGRLMDLWARVAPASWIDRKRWRDSDPGRQVEAALALAADVDGVEAAELAVGALRIALAAFGTAVPSRIRWRSSERDFEHTVELLAKPLEEACSALSARGLATVVLQRARHLDGEIHAAALARLPERTMLARSLGHAAFVDAVWQAASMDARPNPVTALCALWRTGYVLSEIDASGVTLEIPKV